MTKQTIRVGKISQAINKAKVPLSVAVKANGFVFISGLPPIDTKTGALVRGDIEKQTRYSMEAVKAALETAGSSLDKVCKVQIYISNAAYYDTVNRIYGRYFKKNPPARTFVTVGSWPWEFDIEIDCIALA